MVIKMEMRFKQMVKKREREFEWPALTNGPSILEIFSGD